MNFPFLHKFLYLIDLFPFKPYLHIDQKKNVSTAFSKFVSVLFILYTAYVVYTQTIIIFKYESLVVTESNLQKSFNDSTYVDKDKFMMALRFENKVLQKKFD